MSGGSLQLLGLSHRVSEHLLDDVVRLCVLGEGKEETNPYELSGTLIYTYYITQSRGKWAMLLNMRKLRLK